MEKTQSFQRSSSSQTQMLVATLFLPTGEIIGPLRILQGEDRSTSPGEFRRRGKGWTGGGGGLGTNS